MERHLMRDDLRNRIIDAHAHLGMTLKGYANVEYPYAQTLEGLYYRQLAGGVDVTVVFPFSPDLYFDRKQLVKGHLVPAENPLSPAPYAVENRLLMSEVFQFCPEHASRFIPFVSVDPARAIQAQLDALTELAVEFPIYGIKISPILCQSRAIELLGKGQPLMTFARDRDLPILFHTTADPRETFSQPADLFQIIEAYPDLRFCLAHCIGFHRAFLERAAATPNVWVDSSAMTIQVRLAQADNIIMAPPETRFPADYTRPERVMESLCRAFPETMIWGSDSPAYTYICNREQASGVVEEFRLKATYEDEKFVLDQLPEDLRQKAGNRNTVQWLFGKD